MQWLMEPIVAWIFQRGPVTHGSGAPIAHFETGVLCTYIGN